MRFNDSNLPKPTRGIVIVDTTALISMNAEMPDGFLTGEARQAGKPVYFSAALSFLARRGYEIVIPEMVAYETGSVLSNGFSIQSYFPHSPKKPSAGFLAHVPVMEGCIYIQPPLPHDLSEPATFLRLVHGIHKLNGSDDQKRIAIKYLQQYTNRANYGDMVARSLIGEISLPRPDMPVFYFSDDHGALSRAAARRDDIRVHKLNFAGFYEALKDADLLSAIGLVDTPLTDFVDFVEFQTGTRGNCTQSEFCESDSCLIFRETLRGIIGNAEQNNGLRQKEVAGQNELMPAFADAAEDTALPVLIADKPQDDMSGSGAIIGMGAFLKM